MKTCALSLQLCLEVKDIFPGSTLWLNIFQEVNYYISLHLALMILYCREYMDFGHFWSLALVSIYLWSGVALYCWGFLNFCIRVSSHHLGIKHGFLKVCDNMSSLSTVLAIRYLLASWSDSVLGSKNYKEKKRKVFIEKKEKNKK